MLLVYRLWSGCYPLKTFHLLANHLHIMYMIQMELIIVCSTTNSQQLILRDAASGERRAQRGMFERELPRCCLSSLRFATSILYHSHLLHVLVHVLLSSDHHDLLRCDRVEEHLHNVPNVAEHPVRRIYNATFHALGVLVAKCLGDRFCPIGVAAVLGLVGLVVGVDIC